MDRYEKRKWRQNICKRQYQCSCHLLRLAKLARKRKKIGDDGVDDTWMGNTNNCRLFNVSALFPALLVLVFFKLRWRSYLHFVFPLQEVASHYGMLYHTWSPICLCLLLERTWFLFAVQNCLFSVEAPPKDGLPHVEVPTVKHM